MIKSNKVQIGLAVLAFGLLAGASSRTMADILVNTGNPDGLIGMGSRPSSTGKIETEAADDFILSNPLTSVTNGSFTGMLTGTSPTIDQVRVEIYRVFPNDSDVARTSGPPTFSTDRVPTRVNSPSDVAFSERDAASGLTFSTTTLASSFTANNSVLNGIHPIPNQTTGGDGSVTGREVQFTFNLKDPFLLPSDHYFFVPQVQVSDGEFFWLSAPRPIVAPGTPFTGDLQAWIRNEDLAPDWLRVGQDIVGGTTFNATFELVGNAVPEPSALIMGGTAALIGLGCAFRRSRVAV